MQTQMVTIKRRDGAPTLQQIKAEYGLSDDEIDPDFPVTEIDDHLYAINVAESAAEKFRSDQNASADNPDREFHGPYSNPKIEPFGPPK